MPQTIIDKTILEAMDLERFKASNVRSVMVVLNKLSKDIYSTIIGIDTNNPKDINTSIRKINTKIDNTFKKVERMLSREHKKLVKHIVSQEDKSLDGSLGNKGVDTAVATVLSSFVLGEKLNKHLTKISRNTKSSISSAIRNGVVNNENISVISQKVRGTRSRRFRDGLFNRTLTDMDATIRTAIQTYVNRGKQFVWKLNGVERYIWISTLDSSTTSICWRRSNKIFNVGSGPIPPAHYRCRSSIAPYTKGMRVPKSFGEWLRTQPRGVVNEVLGKKKAGMFLNGNMSINKFTTPKGRELTLEELRRRAQ